MLISAGVLLRFKARGLREEVRRMFEKPTNQHTLIRAVSALAALSLSGCTEKPRDPAFPRSNEWNGVGDSGTIPVLFLPPGHNIHVHESRDNIVGALIAEPAPVDKRLKDRPAEVKANYTIDGSVRIYDWDGIAGGDRSEIGNNGAKTGPFFEALAELKLNIPDMSPTQITEAVASLKDTHFGEYNTEIRSWLGELRVLEERLATINAGLQKSRDQGQQQELREARDSCEELLRAKRAAVPKSYFENGRIADVDQIPLHHLVCTQFGAIMTDALNWLGISCYPVSGRFASDASADPTLGHYFVVVPAWYAIIEATASGEYAFAPIIKVEWSEPIVCTTDQGQYVIDRVVFGINDAALNAADGNRTALLMMLQRPEFWETHGVVWSGRDGKSFVMTVSEIDYLAKHPMALGPYLWSLPLSRGAGNFGSGKHFLPVDTSVMWLLDRAR